MGSKWHEISMQIDGRTEIQVKNRFNCIIKRESHIPGVSLQEQVVTILQRLQQQMQKPQDEFDMEMIEEDENN